MLTSRQAFTCSTVPQLAAEELTVAQDDSSLLCDLWNGSQILSSLLFSFHALIETISVHTYGWPQFLHLTVVLFNLCAGGAKL